MIVYQCSPGYSPTDPMNSTCTTNGWTPNPADVDCSVIGPGIFEGVREFVPPEIHIMV